MQKIQEFLRAYVSEATAASLSGKFSSLEEAQSFMQALLPKEKAGGAHFQRFDEFRASEAEKQSWIENEKARGNLVYTTTIQGQSRLRGLCSVHPIIWQHIKNDPRIEKL